MSTARTCLDTNIILIGPMGAGKTTVGRYLAEALGRQFVDSDHEIERRTGANIAWIFDKEGEQGFRQREHQMIDLLTQQGNRVIATGGGVIMNQANHQLLATRGTVVYLYADVELQLIRTMKDRNRPLLQVSDPRKRLNELFVIRDPMYRALADHVVTTNHGSAKDLAQHILAIIQYNKAH